MKRISTLIIFISLSHLINAQNPCAVNDELPFKVGEKLSYELVYNWGFIWAKAGKVDFEVRDTLYNHSKHLYFYSYGSSHKNWDWFYKVRSSYSSITTQQLEPLKFFRIGREGSHYYNNEYSIHGNTASLRSMDDEGKMSVKSFQLNKCAFDVISAIYYCRTLDFSGIKVNDVLPLNLYLDGENFKSQLRYMGKQVLDDKHLGKAYNCIVFKPLLIDGTVFSEGENMTVWVSDDEKKIPLYIETDLVVGKAKIYLQTE